MSDLVHCGVVTRNLEAVSMMLTLPSLLQVSIPLWALVHLPVVVTVTTAIFTPKGWLHCILYVLFENAMGIVKMGAVIAGKTLCSSASQPSSLQKHSSVCPS